MQLRVPDLTIPQYTIVKLHILESTVVEYAVFQTNAIEGAVSIFFDSEVGQDTEDFELCEFRGGMRSHDGKCWVERRSVSSDVLRGDTS